MSPTPDARVAALKRAIARAAIRSLTAVTASFVVSYVAILVGGDNLLSAFAAMLAGIYTGLVIMSGRPL